MVSPGISAVFDSEQRDADGNWIVRTRRSRGAWFGVVVVVGFAILMFASMSRSRHPPGTGAVVFLTIMLLFFVYTLLLAAVNQATMCIGRETVTVRFGPLPQSSGITLATGRIEAFKHVHHYRRKSGSSWSIRAMLSDGKEVRLPLSFRSSDLADTAVQALSRMLADVRNTPGAGP